MKSFAFLVVFLICVNLSLQIPKLVNCPDDFVLSSSIMNSCGVFTCDGPNSFSGVGCGAYQCSPETYLRYIQPDHSKPYPECCGGPVCAD